MRILIADDDPVSRRVLETFLARWGYEVIVATDGRQTWQILQEPGAPHVMVLDWMMPGMGGVELCERVRQTGCPLPAYVILLTSRTESGDIVAGLDAGADDYVTKPFNQEELRARVKSGFRVVELQLKLADRVQELQTALTSVRQLQGLLPICSYCKKIRDDQNYWQQVEQYVSKYSGVQFSHGICPECYKKIVTPQLAKADAEEKNH